MISSEISSTMVRPYAIWTISLYTPTPSLITSVGGIIVWYPACLYSQVLMPAAIQQFSIPIQCFFDQKSCLWAALIYPLPIFHFPNPFQTLMQLCHRIDPVFTITTVLHSTLYLFWKPRYETSRVFVYTS